MAHHTLVTFPGSVKFAPRPSNPAKDAPPWQDAKDAKGKPLKVVTNTHETGAFKGQLKSSTVTCPAGKKFTHIERAPHPSFGSKARPTFILTMVDDAPADVVHAELEHHAAVEALEAVTEGTDDELHEATEAVEAHVIAKSTKHEGVTAKGATAAEAVANLQAQLAQREKKTTDADADAKKKADDAKTAADVAKALHGDKPAPAPMPKEDGGLVEREG
jgi:hypothetical protein